MVKKKSLLWRLLPWLIALVVIGALILFVFAPIYTVKEVAEEEKPEFYSYSGDGQPITMENDELLFTLDPVTTQFTVAKKSNGYVWRSNPEDIDSDTVALSPDKDRLRSTLIATYSTTDGVITHYNNYAYSIENGVYDVTKLEDGAVRVDYTIGKVNKTYFIPVAVPKERMDSLIESLSKSDKRKITDTYRLYDLNKLKASDDAGELKAMYPALVDGPMYILRDNSPEHVKKKLVGYFEQVGYTADDYYADQQYIAGSKTTEIAVFNASIIYRLDGEELIVEVPYDEIRYNKTYPITYLSVLPNFGAAGTDEEGYTLVPDGGGALIKYNNGKISQNSYYANMYGWDWCLERKQAVNETRCSFPAFGMTGGGNAFLCILEGNISYASIQADISGHGNSYNTCNARYAVLHGDQYDVSAKSNNRVYIYEENIPTGSVKQRYHFLDDSGYVQMAQCYRDYLTKNTPELASTAPESPAITIEVLGAIDKVLQKGGLPVTVPIPMTTFEEAGDMMNRLTDSKLENLKMVYTGWSNGGVQQRVLTSVHLVNELGTEQQLKDLLASAKANNVDFYLDGAVEFAYDSDFWNGFTPFRDSAKYTTRDKVLLYPYSTIWYTPMKWRDDNYLVKPAYMQTCAQNLIEAVANYGATGVMFRDVGSILSADYNPRDLVTREQSKAIQLGIMSDAEAKGLKVATHIGNDYSLHSSDLITDMDFTGGAYSILDEQVPFYQIALHGLLNYSGTTINMSGDYQLQVLKAAEYGSGLNFSLMYEKAKVLQDSFYSGYYGSSFEAWGEKAIQIAQDYQQAMSGLGSQRIVDHRRLTASMTLTVYEDGARVYVNYGDKPYAVGGITVAPRSYSVLGGR